MAGPIRRHPALRFVLPLAIIAAIAATTMGYYTFGAGGDHGPDLPTTTVTRGDLQVLVSATGVLEPSSYVDVGAQVSGQLDRIHVTVGQDVHKGDLLAEIDPTVYVAKVDGTRAELKNLKAQVADRKAQLKLAEIQFSRQQNLYREEATTRESLQTAEASLASARAQLAMLQAQMEQTESSLRAEEANLEYAHIYAPMDGTIVSIDARQGQTLNTNQQAPVLMRVANLNTMKVRAQVSEADVGKLRPGMPVYFTTLGAADQRIHGELQYVEPTPEVENNVVLYNALFDVANDSRRLLPSMTAKVFFIARQAQGVLQLPLSAVTRGTVRIKTPKGVEERAVETGISNRVQIEIREGVTEGDEILLPLAAGGSGGDRGPGFRGMLR
ncbi:efflux RND transporter periplasmic adaptor subunit [Marinobacter salinexigens]|uniref:Efflux RND transporter periplasmic adaptor subunit n=1 Tax=Marinobacter salinexigens TaxID=2919747 RepID=A0A5B0VLW2_9GAMM|nr:efflux RND transporter periplasmic adaptor subunit [Marinobacter salinexigens]KAA1175021.1 efflux RND transporter periplasmic adaptor subunit [Marinobacter salinexigens]